MGDIWLPPEKPKEPDRKIGLLELHWEDDRKVVQDAFTMILNVPEQRYCDKEVREARKRLIMNLAVELLGTDFEYEELC